MTVQRPMLIWVSSGSNGPFVQFCFYLLAVVHNMRTTCSLIIPIMVIIRLFALNIKIHIGGLKCCINSAPRIGFPHVGPDDGRSQSPELSHARELVSPLVYSHCVCITFPVASTKWKSPLSLSYRSSSENTAFYNSHFATGKCFNSRPLHGNIIHISRLHSVMQTLFLIIFVH